VVFSNEYREQVERYRSLPIFTKLRDTSSAAASEMTTGGDEVKEDAMDLS
jgi:hypothetical protein